MAREVVVDSTNENISEVYNEESLNIASKFFFIKRISKYTVDSFNLDVCEWIHSFKIFS